jgi:hypothetical protein
MSITSKLKSAAASITDAVTPQPESDIAAGQAIEDRRKAEARIVTIKGHRAGLQTEQGTVRRSMGAEADAALEAGDTKALDKLQGRLVTIEKQIELDDLALAENQQRVQDADLRLHEAKKDERMRDMRTKTNRFTKRMATLGETLAAYATAYKAAVETGDQISGALIGTGLQLTDTGTSQLQISELLGAELALLAPLEHPGMLPIPGAIHKTYYGVPVGERKRLGEEVAQRCEFILRRVGEGPVRPAPANVGDVDVPVTRSAAEIIADIPPANGNGTTHPIEGAVVDVNTAMALSGGIRKLEPVTLDHRKTAG